MGIRALAILAASALLLHNLASPATAEKPAESQTAVTEKKAVREDSPKERSFRGIASYYASRYNGRETTSGAVYDPKKLTAAHQSLPFGTKVKVRNLKNDREVVVTVNDRCAKKRTPFIDLSTEAAKQIGFYGRGITKVEMTLLEKENR